MWFVTWLGSNDEKRTCAGPFNKYSLAEGYAQALEPEQRQNATILVAVASQPHLEDEVVKPAEKPKNGKHVVSADILSGDHDTDMIDEGDPYDSDWLFEDGLGDSEYNIR